VIRGDTRVNGGFFSSEHLDIAPFPLELAISLASLPIPLHSLADPPTLDIRYAVTSQRGVGGVGERARARESPRRVCTCACLSVCVCVWCRAS